MHHIGCIWEWEVIKFGIGSNSTVLVNEIVCYNIVSLAGTTSCNSLLYCFSHSLIGETIMSIIDTLNHSVVSYDPKSSKAFHGQRLAKVTYKTVTDKESPLCGIKRESKCVSLPLVAATDVIANVTVLAPAICEYLQTVQDRIVRERIDMGAASIAMDEISIAGCIEWLENNSESGRLTKEVVATWFQDTISESLAVVLADKLGVSAVPTDAESAKILAVVDQFKAKISSLAGGKTSYEPKICKSLLNALELAPAGDVLATRFAARLNKLVEESKANEDLLALL